MSVLTTVTRSRHAPDRVEVRLKAFPTAALVGLAVGFLAVAAVLHAIDRETAAAWFTGIGEALLFGVVGLVLGERLGAREAESQLGR